MFLDDFCKLDRSKETPFAFLNPTYTYLDATVCSKLMKGYNEAYQTLVKIMKD